MRTRGGGTLRADARGMRARQAFASSTRARAGLRLSHTIHHFAIVALLLHDMSIRVPPRFAYAPGTPSPELAA